MIIISVRGPLRKFKFSIFLLWSFPTQLRQPTGKIDGLIKINWWFNYKISDLQASSHGLYEIKIKSIMPVNYFPFVITSWHYSNEQRKE